MFHRSNRTSPQQTGCKDHGQPAQLEPSATMTSPDEVDPPIKKPWEPEDWLAEVGELHLAEVRMMRDALDDRINDTRSRSLSLLGMIGTALTIAAALGSDLYHPAWLGFAAACFAAGLFCALWCQKARDYEPGPDIARYLSDEYTIQQPKALAIRDLAHEIYTIRADNARIVLKPVLRSFHWQTLFLGLAVLSLLISAALNINSMEETNDQQHSTPATPTSPSTD